ncbi:hypothetical protein Tco_0854429 [Tanacetum coccineum]
MGLGIALGPGYEVGESSAAAAARPAGGFRADYGFDEIVETFQGAPVCTDTEWVAHMESLSRWLGRDTDEILHELHGRRGWDVERGRGTSDGCVRSAHGGLYLYAPLCMRRLAVVTELQSADRRRQRAMSDLLETDRRRREEMRELRAADRTRQQQIIQTLTAVQTLQRETIPLQGLVTTLQGQVTALQGQVMTLQGHVTVLQGQQGPAGGPAQPELPEDTGSSS